MAAALNAAIGLRASGLAVRAALLAAGLWLGLVAAAGAAEGTRLTQVHGLAYSADGARLLVATPKGLVAFAAGRWSPAPAPAHDLRGFAATREALYSSGHPAPGSGLADPLGLIKSRDEGRSWTPFGLVGEAAFHAVAASHRTNAVYVINRGANARMKQVGIFFTLDDGQRWTRAGGRGLGNAPRSLAVHPDDARVVAAGTADGLYLSRDAAGRFDRVVGGQRVLAQVFDLDGHHLWFSTHAGQPALWRLELGPGAMPVALGLPPLTDDAVSHIAQNPVRHAEMAIATFKRDLYLSADAGQTWTAIAIEGVIRP